MINNLPAIVKTQKERFGNMQNIANLIFDKGTEEVKLVKFCRMVYHRKRFSISEIERLCKIFEITPNDLFCDINSVGI